MEIVQFRDALINGDLEEICQETLFAETNWYLDNSGEVGLEDGYRVFRDTVAAQVGIDHSQIHLAGSSRYGFSLSPKPEKTFREFNGASDLDMVIISEDLYRCVWDELLSAYHGGYSWIMKRHSKEIFRRFALLIDGTDYKTTLLRKRSKMLGGIARQVYLRTGVTRSLNYRIYESKEAAVAYHLSGLEKIRTRVQNDA